MGQKVHPIGLRLGIIKTWDSRWFSKKNYAALLHEDIRIRKIVKERLMHAGSRRSRSSALGRKPRSTFILHVGDYHRQEGRRG